jgi:hypothetical protein
MPLVPNDRPTVGGAGAWSCIDTHLLLREETLYGGDEYAAQCCPFAPLMAPHMWILSVSCVYPVKSTSGSCNLCSRVDASFVWRGSKEAWLLEGRGMAPEHVVKSATIIQRCLTRPHMHADAPKDASIAMRRSRRHIVNHPWRVTLKCRGQSSVAVPGPSCILKHDNLGWRDLKSGSTQPPAQTHGMGIERPLGDGGR